MSFDNPFVVLKTFILGKYYPKKLAGILYRKKFNKSINWNNPVNINEKINHFATLSSYFDTIRRLWKNRDSSNR